MLCLSLGMSLKDVMMIKKGRLNFSDDLLFWSGYGNCGGKVWADFAFVEDDLYVYQALEFDGGRQSVAV